MFLASKKGRWLFTWLRYFPARSGNSDIAEKG